MSLDPRVKRFLDLLAAGKPPSVLDSSVAERRAALAELMKFGGPPPPVERVEDVTIPGPAGALPCKLYTPAANADELLPGLIYFHGGGLVAGSLATHDGIARALANAGACRIVSVGYRLAPEHRFPAALEDAAAAVAYIHPRAAQFGIAHERLGICGDSAGATLAAATTQTFARTGGPRLALQLLLCPILDYSRSTESRLLLGSGYLVDQSTLDHDLLHYAPAGTDPADPRISPLRASDLRGLPPTVIHAAQYDPLRDEAQHYAERLKSVGNAVSYRCHEGMIHLFYGLGGVIPYARAAYAEIGGQIRGALAESRACAT